MINGKFFDKFIKINTLQENLTWKIITSNTFLYKNYLATLYGMFYSIFSVKLMIQSVYRVSRKHLI